MMKEDTIKLSDYLYDLPTERIAQQPLTQRDQSNLLVYKGGEIEHRHFYDLPDSMPEGSLLVFNDSKVIPARIYLTKDTGAVIEVLLIHPLDPKEMSQSMSAVGICSWECIIGNKKRWKEGQVLTTEIEGLKLEVSWVDRQAGHIQFSWEQGISFAEVVHQLGQIPLPPYIKRNPSDDDQEQYQTVYAKNDGAVAAPTAGLHFTDEVIEKLGEARVEREYLTLHVGAGTFKPVMVENVLEHDMHTEQFVVTVQNIDRLLGHMSKVVPVGTTSMRVLESLYWLGVKMMNGSTDHFVAKLDPYQLYESLPDAEEALLAVKSYLQENQLEKLVGETAILIVPGYDFKMCKGLVTNFHMPETTLILLVAAFIGDDWRKVYQQALDNDYRFLSYGDSSLLWRD